MESLENNILTNPLENKGVDRSKEPERDRIAYEIEDKGNQVDQGNRDDPDRPPQIEQRPEDDAQEKSLQVELQEDDQYIDKVKAPAKSAVFHDLQHKGGEKVGEKKGNGKTEGKRTCVAGFWGPQ